MRGRGSQPICLPVFYLKECITVIYRFLEEPWEPAYATEALRKISRHPALSLAYKVHATQRLVERGITISDMLHLLKHGTVLDAASAATRPDYFKYVITCITPNSFGREMAAVVIPDYRACTIKIVTVYWVDEQATKAGTLGGTIND
jgi:hypothetical protein